MKTPRACKILLPSQNSITLPGGGAGGKKQAATRGTCERSACARKSARQQTCGERDGECRRAHARERTGEGTYHLGSDLCVYRPRLLPSALKSLPPAGQRQRGGGHEEEGRGEEAQKDTDEVAGAGGTGGTGVTEGDPRALLSLPQESVSLSLAHDMTEGDHVDNSGAGEVDHSIRAFVFLEDGARVSICVWECPLQVRRSVHSKRGVGEGGRKEEREGGREGAGGGETEVRVTEGVPIKNTLSQSRGESEKSRETRRERRQKESARACARE